MQKKPKAKKTKRFSITLPEREGELLGLYAKEHKITRPAAIRRMVRESLKQYKQSLAKRDIQPDNQLGLFDMVQIEMFDEK
ncbi:MAG: hypothetical protein KBT28_04750 [Bacteroidales bacterium]|nr:hypothetical protein [Candidatus Colimorpha merdihippi]